MAIHPTPSPRAEHPIEAFFAAVHLAERQFHKSLDVWPLVLDAGAPDAATRPFLTLDEAMERGTLQVDELAGGASVSRVRVTNKGSEPVLFLFGEQIVGAKQNRVANASFLIAGQSETEVDVSCVEAGRWDARPTQHFHASREVVSHELRAKMASAVESARSAGGGFQADQAEVWDEVSSSLHARGIRSPSSAWSDLAAEMRSERDDAMPDFPVLPGQVGFVAARRGSVAGLEAIGSPPAFARHHGGLLGAYLHGRRSGAMDKPQASFDAPEPFIQALLRAPTRTTASLGLGQDLRFTTPEVSGCALVHEELVHLTAFASGQ